MTFTTCWDSGFVFFGSDWNLKLKVASFYVKIQVGEIVLYMIHPDEVIFQSWERPGHGNPAGISQLVVSSYQTYFLHAWIWDFGDVFFYILQWTSAALCLILSWYACLFESKYAMHVLVPNFCWHAWFGCIPQTIYIYIYMDSQPDFILTRPHENAIAINGSTSDCIYFHNQLGL